MLRILRTKEKIYRKSQAGVALIEFALVVPVLVLLMVGLMEFGRFMYLSILVGNAAHAGAQFGAQSTTASQNISGMQTAATCDGQSSTCTSNTGQSISGISAVASDVCSWWDGTTERPTPPDAATCGQATCSACASGYHKVGYVKVVATGQFHPMLNYGPLGIPSNWNLTKTAYMRVAN